MSRQLALKLACLHQQDRQWILDNLSDEEKAKIIPLLKEIDELGLVANNRSIQQQMKELLIVDAPNTGSSVLASLGDISYLDNHWQQLILLLINERELNKEQLEFKNKVMKPLLIKHVPPKLGETLVTVVKEGVHGRAN